MQEVNDHLLRAVGPIALADRSGSTVVVLLVRGARARCCGRATAASIAGARAGWSS